LLTWSNLTCTEYNDEAVDKAYHKTISLQEVMQDGELYIVISTCIHVSEVYNYINSNIFYALVAFLLYEVMY